MAHALWLGSLYVAGLLAWPLVEYTIHGFLSHRLRTPISPLHWGHHLAPRRVFTSPLAWVPAVGGVYWLAAWALGGVAGAALVAGTLTGFFRYEYVHWRFHFREPRNERESLLRAHHLAHHFRNAKQYHGVTTRFWDRVFGTLPGDYGRDYAAVRGVPPLAGVSNLGQFIPRRPSGQGALDDHPDL